MKILAFVDCHGSLKALERIKKSARKAKPDVVVCAGDISIFEQGLIYFIAELNKIGRQVLVVHGNHETEKDIKKVCSLFKNVIYLHKKNYKIDDYLFFGYGGGGFSLVDPMFKITAKKFKAIIKKNKKAKIILVTHAPPYGTKVDLVMEQHCGNKTIKQFIDEVKPDLVISGHLHENAGVSDNIGNTRMINPGPYGRIIRI